MLEDKWFSQENVSPYHFHHHVSLFIPWLQLGNYNLISVIQLCSNFIRIYLAAMQKFCIAQWICKIVLEMWYLLKYQRATLPMSTAIYIMDEENELSNKTFSNRKHPRKLKHWPTNFEPKYWHRWGSSKTHSSQSKNIICNNIQPQPYSCACTHVKISHTLNCTEAVTTCNLVMCNIPTRASRMGASGKKGLVHSGREEHAT